MRPRLVAISGPLEGQLIELSETEVTTVGRDPENFVHIEDDLVSRRHCEIRCEDEEFRIRDLESRNETLVNGVPVDAQLLRHGDRIEMGYSHFYFYIFESEDMPADEMRLETVQDSEVEGARTITWLQVEDSRFLQPPSGRASGNTVPTTTPSDRTVRDFRVLLEISREISAAEGLENLQERLLKLIFEALPAENAAILLDPIGEPDNPRFSSVFLRQRNPKGRGKFQVSRTVIEKVLSDKQAILSNDVSHDEQLLGAESLKLGEVHSLLCAPFRDQTDVRGVLYLDTTNPKESFDQDDLELLTGVVGIASSPLENARYREWLEEENDRYLDEAIEHNMVGESAGVRALLDRLVRCAASHRGVLILGESGTGKELVARAIHRNSARARKPFVPVNCAALVDTLVETELFGTVRGAFTGAVDRRGKLEYANGGTIFLDEIGEMKPELQAKLLRVIEEKQFERVGGHEPITVDVRIIAATNVDLKKAMAEKAFREDLYYRLSVLTLDVPSLRDRREDIPVLASHFLREASRESSRRIVGISKDARAFLAHYDWPGNIRQLKNAIEHAVDMGSAELIMPEDLPADIVQGDFPGTVGVPGLQQGMKEAKKRLIQDAIWTAGSNITEAARLLQIHPNNLHREIRTLGLRDWVEEFRKGASA